MTEASAVDGPGLESLVARVADEFRERQGRGERPDVEEYAALHPEAAPTLRRVLGSLQLLESLAGGDAGAGSGDPAPTGGVAAASPDGVVAGSPDGGVVAGSPDPATTPGVLGDFRIVRELGRGGMGIVYEAEQISLNRRVALKVLPFAATMDPRHLQRFRNEALAAACLHHTNIVPVFAVGCERGVHFYAMQLIDGCTLADVVRRLRRPAGEASPADPATTAYDDGPAADAAPDSADTPNALAAFSTVTSPGGPAYFRRVAELGAQAAEALDHAHQVGIVHRDVKPGNLLLDGRGRVWVADFGLAHMQHGEASLTMTGDLVGTLRYMSPEQALARRVPIDHRTDVYSLGATLYELLTLQPAFLGKDRQEVLRQIAFEELKPPRRIAKAVPAELEIIVLKAMGKNPAERYGTAQEMADDLRRFLSDRPIRARRPSWRKAAARWVRRHRAAVWGVTAVVVIAALFAGGAGVVWAQQRAATAAEAGGALREADGFQEQGNWPEALASARHADAAATAGPADEGLRDRVRRRRADLEMVARVEEIRLLSTQVKGTHYDNAVRDPEYAQAFRRYGLDVAALGPAEAGARLRATSVPVALAAALDDWALVCKATRKKGDATWKDLLAAARAADPDEWRSRVRDALESEPVDRQALEALASSDRAADQPPSTLVLIGTALRSSGAVDQAIALLRTAQRRHPGDFWTNAELAATFADPKCKQWEKSVVFATVASALRPQSPGILNNLAFALYWKGSLDEAVAACEEAIRLKPDYAEAHGMLGVALYAQARLAEAEKEWREAIRLKPDLADAHNNLGAVLDEQGQPAEAEKECREAIRIKPDFAEAHCNLGALLSHQGRPAEEEKEDREAIRLNPDDHAAHNNLGNSLSDQGRPAEAEKEYREAIRLMPDDSEAHVNLGNLLAAQGRAAEAEKEYREAIRIKPDFAGAHNILGNLLSDQGRAAEAEKEYREVIRIKPDLPETRLKLGILLAAQARPAEAEKEYLEAIRIKPDFAAAHNNLGNLLSDQGRPAEAEKEYREALRIEPEDAEAHNNLGNLLGALGRSAEAEKEYREAIRIKPDFAQVHSNLGARLAAQGRRAEAEKEYREAIRIKPETAETHSNLGAVLSDQGRLAEAEKEYREAIRIKPESAAAHNNLGNLLVAQGQPAEAEKECREAIRIKPDYPEAHYNLGLILVAQGRPAEAEKEYREAIRIQPDYAEAHCNLGLILIDKGQFVEALTHLRRGQELGSRRPGWSNLPAQWVRGAERLAALDAVLPTVLRGQAGPADASAAVDFARLCQMPCKHRYGAAVRFYEEAFAARPELAGDVTSGNRYNAACAAALAGCGQGDDAPAADADRAHLRAQALGWLRADLGAWRALLEKPGANRPAVAQQLRHWREDSDLAGVRDDPALAGLPEAERAEWKALWADLEKTLAKLQDAAPEGKGKDKP